ncbi:MAG: hypothetical protein P8Y96_02100 [Desulfuromonadales bacterium]
MLGQHPAVAEVAVIGMPDEKWGERPLALVVPGETVPTERDLVAYVKRIVDSGVLSRHALTLRVKRVEEIAKTSVGKMDKKLLRQRHLKQTGPV